MAICQLILLLGLFWVCQSTFTGSGISIHADKREPLQELVKINAIFGSVLFVAYLI